MSLRSLSDTFDLTLLQQITRKIIQVQSLHDHDDRAPGLVVEAGEQCIGEPLLDRLPALFRLCVLRFERIIDDDHVSAAACEHQISVQLQYN